MLRLVFLLALVLPAGPAAAQQLLDLNPGPDGSAPLSLYVTDAEPERRFFSANDGTHGRELWVTDGTAEGTQHVADLQPGSGGSSPSDFGLVGGRVVFLTNEGGGSGGVWTTDGTAEGTALLAPLLAQSFGVADGWYYLLTYPEGGTARSYRTDGQTVEEVSGPGGVPGSPVGITSTHLFTSTFVFEGGNGYGEVFATDIATGETAALLGPATDGEWSASLVVGIRKFAVAHDRLYFGASNGNDLHVWMTDGTTGGTEDVFDVPGPDTANNNVELTAAAGVLYLATRYGGLWQIPAAGAAATQVDDTDLRAVYPFGDRAITTLGSGSSNAIALLDGSSATALVSGAGVADFVAVSDAEGFFSGSPNASGVGALWYTDGTPAGTFPVAPPAGTARTDGTPTALGAAGGTILYRSEAVRLGDTGTSPLGMEPWIGLMPEAVVPLPVVAAPGPVTYDGGETGADVTLVDVTVPPPDGSGIIRYMLDASAGRSTSRVLGERWTLNVRGGVGFGAESAIHIDLGALPGDLPAPTTLTVLFQPLEAESGTMPPEPVPLATSYDDAAQTLTATGFTEAGHFTLSTSAPVTAEPSAEASAFALAAFPNPARGGAAITFSLPEAGPVTVAVFDLLGRRVALLHGGPLAAGEHRLRFEATDLPSGVYVVRAATPGGTATRRVTLVR